MNWSHLLELIFWQAPVFLELVQHIPGYVELEKSTKIMYRPINIFCTLCPDRKSVVDRPSKCEAHNSVWPLALLHTLLYSHLTQWLQS